jgi:chromosome segregation ATPase
MIPDGYKSPDGKQQPMQVQLTNSEANQIMQELRSIKQEIVEDMRELGDKIDRLSGGHNELRLEFVRVTTQQETRIAKIEKDVSAFWDQNHKMRAELSRCEADIQSHTATEQAVDQTKKGAADWVRWIPGVLFGLIALGISIFGRVNP